MAINGFPYLSSVSQFTISVWAKLDAINNNTLFSVINNLRDPTKDILFGA